MLLCFNTAIGKILLCNDTLIIPSAQSSTGKNCAAFTSVFLPSFFYNISITIFMFNEKTFFCVIFVVVVVAVAVY